MPDPVRLADVPISPTEILRTTVAGRPVLLERTLSYWRIHEYCAPRGYNRWWEFDDLDTAVCGLIRWYKGEIDEPTGWVRAGGFGWEKRQEAAE